MIRSFVPVLLARTHGGGGGAIWGSKTPLNPESDSPPPLACLSERSVMMRIPLYTRVWETDSTFCVRKKVVGGGAGGGEGGYSRSKVTLKGAIGVF